MAAGIIYETVTVASGASIEMAFYVDDTVTPTQYTPVHRDSAVLAAITGTVFHGDDDGTTSASKIGGRVKTSLSAVTLLAVDKRTDSYFSADGAQFVRDIPLEDIVDGAASNTDGTSTQVIAAAGSGIKQYLTLADISNTGAGVFVALKSGTTSRWRVYVPTGGRRCPFDPPLKPNAANEAWSFDPDSATTTIECSMLGFKSKI